MIPRYNREDVLRLVFESSAADWELEAQHSVEVRSASLSSEDEDLHNTLMIFGVHVTAFTTTLLKMRHRMQDGSQSGYAIAVRGSSRGATGFSLTFKTGHTDVQLELVPASEVPWLAGKIMSMFPRTATKFIG